MSILSWRLRWGFVALLMAAFAAIVFALEPRPYYQDASVFIQLGRGLLTGRAPYSGLFDNKPFGIYLVGALAWLLDPGETTVSMQALSVVAISIAATACGWIVSTMFSRFWPGVATALCVAAGLSLPVLSSGGGTSELFSEAGLAVCASCVVGMIVSRKGYRWPAVAGGAFAWAFACSLLAVAAAPALLILWLTIPIDGQPLNITRGTWCTWSRRRLLDRRLAVAAGTAVLVTLAIWSPVVITGSVSAALDALIHYNSLYQAYSTFDLYGWIRGLKTIAVLILPILAVCLIPVARRRLLGLRLLANSNLFRAAAVWFVVALGLQLVGRRFFDHYLLVLVPSLGLLFGCVVAALRLERVRVSGRFVELALCIVVASGLVWRSTLPNEIPSTTDNAQLAAYMHANTAATDTVLVWGYDPDLYLESDREPTGRYISLLPFLVSGYQQEAVATTLQQWQTHPPLLVVTGLSGSESGLWTLDDSVSSLAPLESFVRAHYEKVASLHGGEVWRYHG